MEKCEKGIFSYGVMNEANKFTFLSQLPGTYA